MRITSKPLRILAMVGIGIVLALVFYAIGLPQKSIGPSQAASSSLSGCGSAENGGDNHIVRNREPEMCYRKPIDLLWWSPN